jgi:hypothetical protein
MKQWAVAKYDEFEGTNKIEIVEAESDLDAFNKTTESVYISLEEGIDEMAGAGIVFSVPIEVSRIP